MNNGINYLGIVDKMIDESGTIAYVDYSLICSIGQPN